MGKKRIKEKIFRLCFIVMGELRENDRFLLSVALFFVS